MIWIFLFLSCFLRNEASPYFKQCTNSTNFDICKQINLDEELLPGTVIDTFKFLESGFSNFTFKIVFTGKNLNNIIYLSILSRSEEFDLVVASRIDKEDFTLNSRILYFTVEVSSTTKSVFDFYAKINDIDDNFPIFANNSYICLMKENDLSANCNNLFVIDYDQVDATCQLDITFVSFGSNSAFNINKNNTRPYQVGYIHSFYITLTSTLDYELSPSIQLQIQAKDKASHVSISNIIIQLIDMPDRPPIFLNLPYYTNIDEELPVDTLIFSVSAIDGDATLKSSIEYSFKNDNAFNQYFDIDATSGNVTIFKVIDRESTDISNVFGFINLNVIATEKMSSLMNSTETVINILINDINDSPAEFEQISYQGSINENSQPGASIYTTTEIWANDKDLGKNAQYKLSVNQNNYTSDVFDIYPILAMNKAILVIRVKNGTSLDYELVKSFNVSIEAQQLMPAVNISNSSFTDVTISLIDMNDNSPIFLNLTYTFTIAENSPRFIAVGTVKATDKDSGNFGRIIYSLNDPFKKFAINSSSGVIYVNVDADKDKTLLDRETYDKLFVVAIATDGGGLMSVVIVTIILTDVNDNPPIFEIPIYQTWLFENSFNFTPNPVKVKAVDKDIDSVNNGVLYKIVNVSMGPSQYLDNFQINSTTGNVTVTAPVDRELIPNNILQLLILATDISNPMFVSTCILQIIVQDVNDNPPVFSTNQISVTIPQNISLNSTILFLNASDADEINTPQSDITYRLNLVDSNSFVLESIVNPVKGVIIKKNPNSRLIVKLYNFTVEASDRGYPPKSNSVIVLINITEINDEPPTFNQTIFTFPTSENQSIGTYIGQVFATDPDTNSNLMYSIVQDMMKGFTFTGVPVDSTFNLLNLIVMNQSNGIVFVQTPLDREKCEKLTTQIKVIDIAAETDFPKQTAFATLEINIIDINDNPPTFQSLIFPISLYEDSRFKSNTSTGATGYYVKANDVDSVGVLRFNHSDPSNSFSIDSISGQIFLIKSLDREAVSSLNFTVWCYDGVFLVNTTVSVTVLDVNDNSPYFVDNITSVMILETTQVGTTIAQFIANDRDIGENGRVTFYLFDNSSSVFSMSYNGNLTLINPLTVNGVFTYKLIIGIMDNPNGSIPFKTFKEVTINVQDVNNNFPIFSQSFYEFNSITEKELIGFKIGEVSATDNDIGENANITYKILLISNSDGIILKLFMVQKVNGKGQILVNSSLKNNSGRYMFKIIAMDNGVPQLNNSCTVVVTVIDFNFYSPNFTNPISGGGIPRFSISENIIGNVTIITAVDLDSGINGQIRFNLGSTNGDHEFFFISPVSGLLSNIRSFDRETKDIYKFRVIAFDLGLPSMTSFADIEVLILDVDDNLPFFPVNNFSITLSILEGPQNFISIGNSSVSGFKIGNVAKAEDRDIRINALISYVLIGNLESFYLDPNSGDLYGRTLFDRELIASYESIVRAIPKSQFGPEPRPVLAGYSPYNNSECKVIVIILDINDNPPIFITTIIIGGIIQNTPSGSPIVDFSKYVIDKDLVSQNSLVYSVDDIFPSRTDLATQLKIQNINNVFNLNTTTGIMSTAPGILSQEYVKGFIQMTVTVSDGKYKNSTQSIIYFIGYTQQVIVVIQNYPDYVAKMTNDFVNYLSNNLKITIFADSLELFKDVLGNVPIGLTNLYIHAVNMSSNTVLSGSDLLQLINQKFPNMTYLMQNYQVLEFKIPSSISTCVPDNFKIIFIGFACGIFFLLFFVLIIVLICRAKYQRKLKAYGTSSIDNPATINNQKVPGTNIYEKNVNPLSKSNQENHSNFASPKYGNKTNKKIGIPVYGNEISFQDILTNFDSKFNKNVIENTETTF